MRGIWKGCGVRENTVDYSYAAPLPLLVLPSICLTRKGTVGAR
jgi:hypothetical protein